MKKLVCTTLLLGILLPVYSGPGSQAGKALQGLFIKESESALLKNLSRSLSHNIRTELGINVVIVNALEKKAAAYAVLGTPKIQPLTKAQVWPDEAEARYILATYLQKGNPEVYKPDYSTPYYVSQSMAPSPEKYIYGRMLEEEALYKPEIQAAFDIYSRLHRANIKGTALLPENQAAAQKFIDTQVVSADLRKYLQLDLEEGNIEGFMADVADYYGILGEDETEAALRFVQRYPHARTLALKRALHSPFTPSAISGKLRQILQKKEITAADYDVLRSELYNLFMARQFLKSSVVGSESVRNQKKMMTEFSGQLEEFLTKNGRMPSWDSADANERLLSEHWQIIYKARKNNDFGSFQIYYQQLDQLLQKFGIPYQRFYKN